MSSRDQMRIKSYFAKSVDEAMTQAREELGAEAMLLNTRKAPPGQLDGGGYEVIFGLAEDTPAVLEESAAPLVTAPEVRVESGTSEHSASDLERLHDQLDEIRSLILSSSRAQVAIGQTVPGLAEIYARLVSADVEPALSKDIVDRLEASMAAAESFETMGPGSANTANRRSAGNCDLGRLEALLRVELENRVALAPELGAGASLDDWNGSVVVLVGPRGAGKTTSLAKLAVLRNKSSNAKPARLLSLDMSRATAHLQLQAVANKHKIAFQDVPAAYLLPGLITETRQKETIFVDTPGYTAADANSAEAAAAAFAECPQLDVHLVVPAYMKARDLRLCIQKYAPFRPSKLLVTKLDETDSLGSVFSEAARARLKLSFMAYGPGIPHDIRPASSKDLMSMAVEQPRAHAQRVA